MYLCCALYFHLRFAELLTATWYPNDVIVTAAANVLKNDPEDCEQFVNDAGNYWLGNGNVGESIIVLDLVAPVQIDTVKLKSARHTDNS